MNLSRLLASAALLLGFAQPVASQDLAYTRPPKLQNRAEITAMVDSIVAQLSDPSVQSRTLLWAKVRVNGSTSEVSVRESSRDTLRDNIALRIVQRMRWTPAENAKGPIDTWIAIPIVLPRRGGKRQ